MAVSPSADQMVGILRETVVALVRRDGADLSARQLGVFLTCYLRDGGHTVRGLAAELKFRSRRSPARSTGWANSTWHGARWTRWIAAASWCSAR